MTAMVDGVPLVNLLPRVAVADRPKFARALLNQVHPDLVEAFDSWQPDQRARSVLFLGNLVISREHRFAKAARLGGWHPILVCGQQPKFPTEGVFTYHKVVKDDGVTVLVNWLFPGPLVHVFAAQGKHAELFVNCKHQKLILDLYDTTSGIVFERDQGKQIERTCIAAVDGMTHRDIRIKYLQRLYGYQLPRHNVFMHDPLFSPAPLSAQAVRRWLDSEIHVISVGWREDHGGGTCILRLAQVLCAHRIHVHVAFSRMQEPGHPETKRYYDLQRCSPYFHIEDTVYGEEYWRRLRGYDFGLAANDALVFGEENPDVTRDDEAGCGSSRLSDYIDADLAIIQAPGHRFQYFWARRYGRLVVPADLELLRNPRQVLEAALASKARQPPKDRSHVTFEGAAPRLCAFYEKVIAE